MSALIAAAMVLESSLTETNENRKVLSGILGSISLIAWICLLIPQMAKNYQEKRSDGLSMIFITIWVIGDIAYLIGSIFLHLAPSAIALGFYFLLADLALIWQSLYYRAHGPRLIAAAERDAFLASRSAEEAAPLLANRRRTRPDPPEVIGLNGNGSDLTWWQNVLCILAVYVLGAGAWAIPYFLGLWDATPDVPTLPDSTAIARVGSAFGYFSAFCYLLARIPQILYNYREKSCEGLSLLFWMYSISGNLMLGLSIIAYAQTGKQMIDAIPWLIGTFGTTIQDCIIFIQFSIYARAGPLV